MVAALGSLAINEGVAASEIGISADSAAKVTQVVWKYSAGNSGGLEVVGDLP